MMIISMKKYYEKCCICGGELKRLWYDVYPLRERGCVCHSCHELVVAADNAMEEFRRKGFEIYFQKHGLSQFEEITGWSFHEFQKVYEEFTEYVQDYYFNTCRENNFEYVPNMVHWSLVADICFFDEMEFYVTMGKDYRVHRFPLVNVLKAEYYITNPPTKMEFLACEEVMKQLIETYWYNMEYFEETKVEMQMAKQQNADDEADVSEKKSHKFSNHLRLF